MLRSGARAGQPDGDEAIRLMCAAHASSLDVRIKQSDAYALASTGDLAPLPGGGQVAVIGQPVFADATIQAKAQSQGPAAALAALYQSQGEALTSRVDGHFSYAVVDAKQNCLHAGIDRLGIYPLYFASLTDGVVWGTDARTVMTHPDVQATLEPQALYDYVFFHMIPSPGSVHSGLHKLPAAHRVAWAGGELTTQRYWLPNFNPPGRARRPDQDDYAKLRSHLKTAVSRCLDHGNGRTGAFLSGGLDSSSVVGMLAECTGGDNTHAFAIGFDAKGYDEMPFARISAAHFGATLHEYYVTPDDVVAALPLIAASYDEPFGNSSALPAYFCARFAREQGMDALLAGDGGDELFAGNERYARQLMFERYRSLPGALRHG
ncbi:MAG: asparagine synthase-related protein, partial [Chromatocurvus sp.]